MKILVNISVFFMLLLSCNNNTKKYDNTTGKRFSPRDSVIFNAARNIISDCYYCTMITIDAKGYPKARVMEPFTPDENFTIWLATNPRSRKVTELKNNPNVTIHYFSKRLMAYVSLIGKAVLINDEDKKQQYWKKGWEKFYSDRKKDYILIRFDPKVLELIDIPRGLTGDKNTWKPEQVIF